MGRFEWLVLGATVALGGCAGDTTGASGGDCTTGSEGCACYPNNTCDAALTCASHLCVSLGTGGSGQGGKGAVAPTPADTGGTLGYGGFFAGVGGSVVGGSYNFNTGGYTSPPIAGFQIQAGGYVVAGPWHGYAWTAAVTSGVSGAASTTIRPTEYSGIGAGATELCAGGAVGQASDYGGVAILGVNVNQTQLGDGGDPPVGTVAIGGSGITVRYSNVGGSVIRVEIQTAAGATDPTGRWCATLSGAGGTETVAWEQFWGGTTVTTDGCWNSGGAHPPVGAQIREVSLLVPGGNVNPVPFSFCLQGLAQAG